MAEQYLRVFSDRYLFFAVVIVLNWLLTSIQLGNKMALTLMGSAAAWHLNSRNSRADTACEPTWAVCSLGH